MNDFIYRYRVYTWAVVITVGYCILGVSSGILGMLNNYDNYVGAIWSDSLLNTPTAIFLASGAWMFQGMSEFTSLILYFIRGNSFTLPGAYITPKVLIFPVLAIGIFIFATLSSKKFFKNLEKYFIILSLIIIAVSLALLSIANGDPFAEILPAWALLTIFCLYFFYLSIYLPTKLIISARDLKRVYAILSYGVIFCLLNLMFVNAFLKYSTARFLQNLEIDLSRAKSQTQKEVIPIPTTTAPIYRILNPYEMNDCIKAHASDIDLCRRKFTEEEIKNNFK